MHLFLALDISSSISATASRTVVEASPTVILNSSGSFELACVDASSATVYSSEAVGAGVVSSSNTVAASLIVVEASSTVVFNSSTPIMHLSVASPSSVAPTMHSPVA